MNKFLNLNEGAFLGLFPLPALVVTIILLFFSCSETITETVTIIDEAAIDSLEAVIDSLELEADSVITHAEISVSPLGTGYWEDDYFVSFLSGIGVNLSDSTIEDVSVEFTITADKLRRDILSETVGYFITQQPLSRYIPNSPFPYEIQHDLEPNQVTHIYVGADTIRVSGRLHWWFRVTVGSGLSKRVNDWQYGGEIRRE